MHLSEWIFATAAAVAPVPVPEAKEDEWAVPEHEEAERATDPRVEDDLESVIWGTTSRMAGTGRRAREAARTSMRKHYRRAPSSMR